MSEQDNIQVVREYQEAGNAHDLDRIVALVDEGAVLESDCIPGSPMHGNEAFRQVTQAYFSAFPDLHWGSEQEIASGDYVVTRWRATGTHQGALGDIQPTNRKVDVQLFFIFEIRNGKVAHAWLSWNNALLLEQIGAMPS